MASPQQKLVKVGDDIVVFPGDMENDHIAKLVKSFHEKKKKSKPVATEESEHTRQLKAAQPLSTVIPSTGAALGLQAVKKKAEELQAQFRKAGLSQ